MHSMNLSEFANFLTGKITRREFNKRAVLTAAAVAPFCLQTETESAKTPVAIVKSPDRRESFHKLVELLGIGGFEGKEVYIKGNFNSPDRFPATTHPDTLASVAEFLKAQKCQSMTLVERSGMGESADIWRKLGISQLAQERGIRLMSLENLPVDEWQQESLPGSHWKNGIEIPKFLTQKTCIVQVCSLKTHRFGGQFSASLKNSVGLIAKRSFFNSQHNYMAEFIVMDAMQIFINGGPERGEIADIGVMAASRDRVALDAVGLALLKLFGAGQPIKKLNLFEQEQIRRASELALGVKSAKEIQLITPDKDSNIVALQIGSYFSETFSEEDDKSEKQ
jgi:uncharacterized protein (DUF362 family)